MLRTLASLAGGYAGALAARLLGAESSPLDPTSPTFWTSLGIAGLVMVSFGREWVVAGSVLRRTEKRAEIAEQAIRDLTPALTRHNDAADRMLDFLAEQERKPKGRS